MSKLSSITKDVNDQWQTSDDYSQSNLQFPASKFLEITDLLLANPNLNSTHLFRADILFDSAGILQTPEQKENSLLVHNECQNLSLNGSNLNQQQPIEADSISNRKTEHSPTKTSWPDFSLQRTVVRRLIPRKPQLDEALEQTCLIYASNKKTCAFEDQELLVVYYPKVEGEESMPWYHPPVRSLAYLYQPCSSGAKLSLHFLLFSKISEPIPPRLHRTFLSLLQTFVRLAKYQPRDFASSNTAPRDSASQGRSLASADLKDTIIPQHQVQDTYTRLKQKYAPDLIRRWVESTEPSKHVFEDLSIAAFLIELWKQMYNLIEFPGFVDIACGNGVLVYVLVQEGYQGYGFDARRRKTWDVLGIEEHLREQICVPKPFLDVLTSEGEELLSRGSLHDGIFKPGTFIISNHADELTPWTPILALLSSPGQPLPFLAIPCCSHALSGVRHRYSPRDIRCTSAAVPDGEEQPASGDFKALRAVRAKAANHSDDKSMYACLTRKVIALAEDLGFDVELTLMRIPSTRNIGIVGNRRRVIEIIHNGLPAALEKAKLADDENSKIEENLHRLLERECASSGGIQSAAKTWLERARKLQMSKGRGKVNLSRIFDQ